MKRYIPKARQCTASLLLLALTACGTRSSLNLRTAPEEAELTATNASGDSVRLGKPRSTGVKLPIDFESDRFYEVKATPIGEAAETHLPTVARIDPSVYEGAPAPSGEREFVIELDRKAYVLLEDLLEQLDPQGRWATAPVARRSFNDIEEVGGSAPALIYDFGSELGVSGIDIAPDGERMVFSQSVYETRSVEVPVSRRKSELREVSELVGSNLMSLRIGSRGLQHLTSDSFLDKFPAYTADGQHLVFSSNRRQTGLSDILRIRSTGRSGFTDIFVSNRESLVMRPTVANNGVIAMEVRRLDRVEGEPRLREPYVWTVGGEDGYPTQVIRGSQPSISPDGENIAFIGTDGNLWVTAADGSSSTQLTLNAREIETQYYASLNEQERVAFDELKASGFKPIQPYSLPTWSPDGQYIAYSSWEGLDSTGRPNEDIWIMNFDAGSKRQLTTNGSVDTHALFAPDQKGIYFLSNRGHRWAIWRIYVDLSL
ncbi:hypothetical protein [Pelagicoccus sp. SDUM812005]|uniref:TolB family protein n=1 Tax=Pelagicoccus sp. SDUM812005 TaxID=3041257 RepID=UPI00280F08B6|nr:hypothetical protein [Pelagicoccus sp. SDUM812005]MDQ8180001.1 hypothetical protein [Pelagicoccus sp. SDUM812005]